MRSVVTSVAKCSCAGAFHVASVGTRIDATHGRQHLARILPEVLADAGDALSPAMQRIIERLRSEWRAVEDAIRDLTRQITVIARHDAARQPLVEIPGFG